MNVLTKITEHVYWMPPGPPDRPSLCAVVGDRHTIMLDGGSSAAHASAFLVGLLAESRVGPSAVVYTHSHWDHVLGGAEVGGLVLAHALTAGWLVELAERDWSDDGLERRHAAGLSSLEHVENVKAELPPPRVVEVVPADIVFHDRIEVDLGRVTVHVHHVGGDHSADSSLMFVEPDAVLFLGDCMYPSPEGALTAESADGDGEPVRENAAGRGCRTRRMGNTGAGRGHPVLRRIIQRRARTRAMSRYLKASNAASRCARRP